MLIDDIGKSATSWSSYAWLWPRKVKEGVVVTGGETQYTWEMKGIYVPTWGIIIGKWKAKACLSWTALPPNCRKSQHGLNPQSSPNIASLWQSAFWRDLSLALVYPVDGPTQTEMWEQPMWVEKLRMTPATEAWSTWLKAWWLWLWLLDHVPGLFS